MRLVLVALLLAGCHPSFGTFQLPLGGCGTLPDTVGPVCRVRQGEGVVRIADHTFTTLAVGEAIVRCSAYDVTLRVEEIATLKIDGSLVGGEFTVSAISKSGATLDLSLLSNDAIEWSWPEFMQLRLPSCGHMMPVCSGTIGNGRLMKGYVLNQRVGEGFVTVRIGGVEGRLAVKAGAAKD